jgi:hypothetical protein
MKNYGYSGTCAVNFHYNASLISSYFNHLFHEIFIPGVVGIYQDCDIQELSSGEYITSTAGTHIKISKTLSLLLRPNNQYEGGDIELAYKALSNVNKKVINYQILKCDIIKDFILLADHTKPYLLAEYNWGEFENNLVDFKFSATPATGNQIEICRLTFTNFLITSINYTSQTSAALNNNILYSMNIDTLNSYHVGNESGYIPINNEMLNMNLNAEFLNGYSGVELAKLGVSNSGLNAEVMVDLLGSTFAPGNSFNQIPLSNGQVNIGLDAEFLGGVSGIDLAKSTHKHNYDAVIDGPNYKKIRGGDGNNLATDASFIDYAFISSKLNDISFLSANDDAGGKLKIVTGKLETSSLYTTVDFGTEFTNKPVVLLQIIDDGSTTYNTKHIKINARDISTTSFLFSNKIYLSAGSAPYTLQSQEFISVYWAAVGYSL